MKRDTKVTIGFVVAAVLILAAQLFFLWVWPEPAEAQSLKPSPEQQQQRATDRFDTVQVRILTTDSDLDWTGYIMGSDMSSQSIEGEGDDSILMRCDEDDMSGFGNYSVTFSKSDDNDEGLAVQIVQNGTVIKEARTDAEFGIVSVAGNC
jgi:hypothetical protein